MYNPVKYGCKWSNSSTDMVKTVKPDYTSPHCDLDLEENKPTFSLDTLAHNDESTY